MVQANVGNEEGAQKFVGADLLRNASGGIGWPSNVSSGAILYGGSGADVGLYVRLYVRLCVEVYVDGTAETVWECVIMSVSVLG